MHPINKNRVCLEKNFLTNTCFKIEHRYPMTGWSNFCTLVGRFSELFEFAGLAGLAGLNRLKTSIFVPKSGYSLKKKKKVFTWNRSPKFLFLSQNHSAAACNRQGLCKIVPRAAQIPSAGL